LRKNARDKIDNLVQKLSLSLIGQGRSRQDKGKGKGNQGLYHRLFFFILTLCVFVFCDKKTKKTPYDFE